MSSHSSTIGDALFTKTQQRVLGLLYGKPQQSYYLNEIVRLAGVGKGSIKRELEKFCEAGLLTVKKQGNQSHYQANRDNPIFAELKQITQKTFGIADTLRLVLAPLGAAIDYAFIYGSVAKGTENAASDIDLMLVAEGLSYSDVIKVLGDAESQLGRTINPTLYSPDEFSERMTNNQHFITRVMRQPKLWLIGEWEPLE